MPSLLSQFVPMLSSRSRAEPKRSTNDDGICSEEKLGIGGSTTGWIAEEGGGGMDAGEGCSVCGGFTQVSGDADGGIASAVDGLSGGGATAEGGAGALTRASVAASAVIFLFIFV